jgi:type IV pilus assembly protein PilW
MTPRRAMPGSRGFSLVELMVAITLALITTAGVLGVFVGSRSAAQSTAGTAAITDGGRFALDFLQNAVRSAGYMACNTAQRQISILNLAATPLPYSFNEPLGGFEANGTGIGGAEPIGAAPVIPDSSTADWVGGLDASMANVVVQGNDVLVVRSTLANTQAVYVTSILDGADNFTINTQGGLAVNQLAVISDCAKSVVMQISSLAAGANPVIYHDAGGSPGNGVASFPVSFGTGSQVTAVDTIAYYIGKGADGDGALFAYDLYDNNGLFSGASPNPFTAKELVPDIEAMQVLYGLDTTGTQTASEYVTADQVPDFNSVMSVKIAVLAASPPGAARPPAAAPTFNLFGTTVTAPIDTRTRQVFEITIAVRNSVT